MSGIYGMVRTDPAPVTPEMLAPMAAAMAFYGIDGQGQWIGDSAGLGHCMLHTTPEARHERMPASIRIAPHLVITADARIDNRGDLFDALGVPPQGRTKTPDSSLILLAYERWGAACTGRLLGDFAFAIWNTRDRTLFCARDPFGCRPFVYSHNGARLIFASDVRGVVACMEAPRLNEPLLAAHLQMHTYHAQKRQTFFQDAVKLPPGHTLTLNRSGVQVSRYWSPDEVPGHRGNDQDIVAELRHLFIQSVACRLRGDFEAGAHLSGGLDSSATTVATARVLRDRNRGLRTFSWSPPPASNSPAAGSEYSRIAAVCRQERLECEYLPVTVESLTDVFRSDFTVEPTAMMARESNVQRKARAQGVRVLLSGWGGDLAVTCRTDPKRGGLRGALTSRLPDSVFSRLVADPFMKHASPCVRADFARRYRAEVEDMRGPAMRPLPDVRGTILRRLDIGHVSLRMEAWAASGARHGLAYSYPMLDRRLVEFATGLAADAPRRPLFSRAIRDLLPSPEDWGAAKTELRTFAALETAHITAHSQWAERLASSFESPSRFTDPHLIVNAVQTAARTGKSECLRGVKEAFGCYTMKPR